MQECKNTPRLKRLKSSSLTFFALPSCFLPFLVEIFRKTAKNSLAVGLFDKIIWSLVVYTFLNNFNACVAVRSPIDLVCIVNSSRKKRCFNLKNFFPGKHSSFLQNMCPVPKFLSSDLNSPFQGCLEWAACKK